MLRWRLTVAVCLTLFVGLPLVLPFVDLLRHPVAWRTWEDGGRLLLLARNTLFLIAGVLVLALPAGVAGAVLLYRTNLPFRRPLRLLLLLTLFVPLPVLASGWQAALGSGGWLAISLWNAPFPAGGSVPAGKVLWTPWGQGMAAVWVQAAAAVPWVVLLVGQGLCWVERELEEDALTVASPWQVFRRVTLPRARAALGAAAVWVIVQTATEMTVTDMFQVRSFAEEVYTQFVMPDFGSGPGSERESLARAVAVSIPAVVLLTMLVLWAGRRWEARLPPLTGLLAHPRSLPLGRARWPAFLLVLGVLAILAGIPLGSLCWKLGLAGAPRSWSAEAARYSMHRAIVTQGGLVAESLLAALGAGICLAVLGLVACWLAGRSRGFRVGLFLLVAVAWAMPGPVVGIGLKRAIELACDWTGSRMVAVSLYYGPSPVPLWWAYVLRFFPYAVALLWPVVRLLPAELRESAELDGASPTQVLWYVVVPLTWPAALRAALAVAVLCLGELGASKLVETPGSNTFTHEVFNQMHYGVGNDLAALCLVLLTAVVGGGALLLGVNRLVRRRLRGWVWLGGPTQMP